MALRETAQIMSHREMARMVQKEVCIQWRLLDLALWEQTMREGRKQYMTEIDSMDVVVWRDQYDTLIWRCTPARWIQDTAIDQLDTYLREHGFRGDRINDDAHQTVIFLAPYGRGWLHVHLLHQLSTHEQDIEELADRLLHFEEREAQTQRVIKRLHKQPMDSPR